MLAGKSDLAEIAILCAVEAGAAVVAIVDPHSEGGRFVGVEVFASYSDVKGGFDAIIVTDVARAQEAYEQAAEASGKDRVLVPACSGCVRKRMRRTLHERYHGRALVCRADTGQW